MRSRSHQSTVTRFITFTALVAALAGISVQSTSAAALKSEEPPRTVGADDIYDPPTKPLDERIDPSRITRLDPPPLPEEITLPLAPTFRLAESHEHVPVSREHWDKAHEAIERGISYLRKTQDENGGWMVGVQIGPTDEPDRPSPVSLAVTAMTIKALVQHDPTVMEAEHFRKALNYVLNARRPDGSFEGGRLANYVTASVVSALASLEEPRYQPEIRDGANWLMGSQWHQEQGVSPEHDWFGGAGYGNHGRPDLSNTQMMLDALYDAGISPDEPAFQRAVAFLTRAQNLSETNPAEWAGDDGGFIYTPAYGGESFASEAAGEGRRGELIPEDQPRSLRSYGSMTYAGFKSLLYAGMSPDDVRVRAAFDWIRKHFTFDENPGMGLQGLYYYYHAMARTLVISQQDIIVDHEGNEHNWREEMIDAIVARQREDGSWSNEADRWLEGESIMATVYAVLSLEETLKDAVMRNADDDVALGGE